MMAYVVFFVIVLAALLIVGCLCFDWQIKRNLRLANEAMRKHVTREDQGD